MMKSKAIYLLVLCVCVNANKNIGFELIEKIYDECQNKELLLKCFKIEALKITNRILNLDKIDLGNDIHLVRRKDVMDNMTNSLWYPIWARGNYDNFTQKEIDQFLRKSLTSLFSSRRLYFQSSQSIGEARKGGDKKTNFGPLIAAIAIKTGLMAMAYKGIIATAGVALLVGKMALLLCAIMSLKKLIAEKGDKGTTVEIVKHPTHSVSNTHSSSYEDDHDHYHRSIASGEDLSYPEEMIHSYKPHHHDEIER